MSNIKFTKEELRRDYEEASYDRKNLSIKYNTFAKGKDIQDKIISILKEIRSTQTEFNTDDITDWFRLDPKVTKLSQYLDGEPIAFVKMLQVHYESRAKRGGNSIAGKYASNMFNKITAWLNEATKTDDQKAADAELDNNIENLVSKLSDELEDFKVRYLEKVHEAAGKRYKMIPTDIEALKNHLGVIPGLESDVDDNQFLDGLNQIHSPRRPLLPRDTFVVAGVKKVQRGL